MFMEKPEYPSYHYTAEKTFRETVHRTRQSHWKEVNLRWNDGVDSEEMDSLIPLCKQYNLKIDHLLITTYESFVICSKTLLELCINVCLSEFSLRTDDCRSTINLCRGLISAPTIALTSLNLRRSPYSPKQEEACPEEEEEEVRQAIVESFRSQSSTLHHFSSVGWPLEKKQIVHIAETLEMPHTSLQSLELVNTYTSTGGLKRLAKAIRCSQLQTLEFWCGLDVIGEKGIGYLSEALQGPSTRLQELSFKNTTIADKGLRHLARALQNPNSSLQKLSLSLCHIGDEGVKSLAEALKTSNSTLKILDLGWNEITDEGAIHIACILESMNGLEELHIERNKRMSEVGGAIILRNSLQRPHNMLKNMWLHKVGDEGAEYLLSSLRSPHCHLVRLYLIPTTMKVLTTIADSLQLPGCKLQVLYLWGNKLGKNKLFFEKEDLEGGRRKLLLALDSCYWCPLRRINDYIRGDDSGRVAFDRTSASLIKRNAAIREGDLLGFERQQPSTGKLFVCGNATDAKRGIVKSILYQNPLQHLNPFAKSSAPLKERGMNLNFTPLPLGNLQNLLVSEVEEADCYFPFFSSAPRQSVFLVVCNVPQMHDCQDEIDKQLRYWLKSIKSSSSYHGPRPKVIICLCFPPVDGTNLGEIAWHRTEFIIREFQPDIDFGNGTESNLFALVGDKRSKVEKKIRERIKGLFHELQSESFLTPRICMDLLRFLPTEIHGRMFPASSVGDIVSSYRAKSCATETNIKAALQLLHFNGYLIYHPIIDIVILAPEFLARILHCLKDSSMIREDIVARLLQELKVPSKLVYHLLYCLRLEGIVTPKDQEWDADLTRVPKNFFNPMLATTEVEWLSKATDSACVFWGRRFECQDKQTTQLPRQLFMKLQSTHASCAMGAKWIRFVQSGIQVIVQIGGKEEGWKEMQWIDILFKVSEERKDDSQQDFILGEVVNQIHNLCYGERICPSVKLHEEVIDNDAVRSLELCNARTELLGVIIAELEEHGLNHVHRWNNGNSVKVEDLLSPLEVRAHLWKSEQKLMKEFDLESFRLNTDMAIAECSSTCERRSIRHRLMEALPVVDVGKWVRQFVGLDKIEQKIDAGFGKVDAGMEEQNMLLKELVSKANRFEKAGADLNSKLTEQLLQMMSMVDLPFPRLPYLTNQHGLLEKLSSLFKTTCRLQFMCEWQGGAHNITLGDHEGFKMTLEREWLIRAAPILMPALKILSLAARTAAAGLSSGACSFPLPSSMGNSMLQKALWPEVLKAFATGLEAELRTDWHAKPDPALLQEFLKRILPRGLSLKEFGLVRVHTPSGIVYLCDRHSKCKGYTRTENQYLST